MRVAKLKARSLGRPALLVPAEQRETEKAQRLKEKDAERQILLNRFLDWFREGYPGAEWEPASFDGLTLYCRWYMDPERPEWGKVFCAIRIDRPFKEIEQAFAGSWFPPLDWDHWAWLELDPSSTREQLIPRFHERCAALPDRRRLTEIAYRRALADVFCR